jgi:hypothetical protein
LSTSTRQASACHACAREPDSAVLEGLEQFVCSLVRLDGSKRYEAFCEVLVVTGRLFAPESSRQLTVSVVVDDRGAELVADRFEASLADYPLVRELGRTPWEAVNRLVGGHRALLERRWLG